MPNELIKRRFLPAGATAAGKRRINHRFVSAAELLNDWNDAGEAAVPSDRPRPRSPSCGPKERVQSVAIIVLKGGFYLKFRSKSGVDGWFE